MIGSFGRKFFGLLPIIAAFFGLKGNHKAVPSLPGSSSSGAFVSNGSISNWGSQGLDFGSIMSARRHFHRAKTYRRFRGSRSLLAKHSHA